MSRWFLSCHSLDQALAQRVEAAVEQRDCDASVFFAPQHNRAGGFWTAQLAQEIADEPLPNDVRVKLAETLSNTMMGIEIWYPTDSVHLVDWMWFHTLPADGWAVGGRFEETYVRGRKMCFARIIAPEALLNSELRARALAEVTKNIKDALCVDPGHDGSGIWVICTEVPQGTWASGGSVMVMSELLDRLGGQVSQTRREEMKAKFAGQAKLKEAFRIPS